jgi:hypothetical protein
VLDDLLPQLCEGGFENPVARSETPQDGAYRQAGIAGNLFERNPGYSPHRTNQGHGRIHDDLPVRFGLLRPRILPVGPFLGERLFGSASCAGSGSG